MAKLFQRQSPVETEDSTARSSAKAELPKKPCWSQNIAAIPSVCNTSWSATHHGDQLRSTRYQYIRWLHISLINVLFKPRENDDIFTKSFCYIELEFANRKGRGYFRNFVYLIYNAWYFLLQQISVSCHFITYYS